MLGHNAPFPARGTPRGLCVGPRHSAETLPTASLSLSLSLVSLPSLSFCFGMFFSLLLRLHFQPA